MFYFLFQIIHLIQDALFSLTACSRISSAYSARLPSEWSAVLYFSSHHRRCRLALAASLASHVNIAILAKVLGSHVFHTNLKTLWTLLLVKCQFCVGSPASHCSAVWTQHSSPPRYNGSPPSAAPQPRTTAGLAPAGGPANSSLSERWDRVPELTLLGRKDGARRTIISFLLGFIKLECEPILLPSRLSENSALKIL